MQINLNTNKQCVITAYMLLCSLVFVVLNSNFEFVVSRVLQYKLYIIHLTEHIVELYKTTNLNKTRVPWHCGCFVYNIVDFLANDSESARKFELLKLR